MKTKSLLTDLLDNNWASVHELCFGVIQEKIRSRVIDKKIDVLASINGIDRDRQMAMMESVRLDEAVNTKSVSALEDEEYDFVTDIEDVDLIKDRFKEDVNINANPYSAFYVKYTDAGDIEEAWGINSSHPDDEAFRVFPATDTTVSEPVTKEV